MRSQKKNNRSPRPFKNHGSDRSWSGGHGRKDSLPPLRNLFVAAKKPGQKSDSSATGSNDESIAN
jgi:hypothetical protein